MISGGHLTDATGRTLYLWVADSGAKSTCVGACASVWPPVLASGTPTAGTGADAAKLTTIARSDGGSQLAYAGHPLYYFTGDKTAGQATGQGNDGFGAKWWEVNAAGQAITSTSGAAGSTTAGSGNGY
jgi:predicted lipoprotein with Yx(FWY)xxD motif